MVLNDRNNLRLSLLDSSFLLNDVINDHDTNSGKIISSESKHSLWNNYQYNIIPKAHIKTTPCIKIPKFDSCFNYLKVFFSKSMIDHILIETNKSIDQQSSSASKNKLQISASELTRFIGITILMGIIKLPNYKMHWENSLNAEKYNYQNNFIRKQMSYSRYSFIRSNFRLTKYLDCDLESNATKVKEKTSGIINALNKLFRAVYVPGENICIDETTIPFKGNCSVKVYNPAKPKKWGLSVKTLYDSTTKFACAIKLWDGERQTLKDKF